jgi:hypothetical protein
MCAAMNGDIKTRIVETAENLRFTAVPTTPATIKNRNMDLYIFFERSAFFRCCFYMRHRFDFSAVFM